MGHGPSVEEGAYLSNYFDGFGGLEYATAWLRQQLLYLRGPVFWLCRTSRTTPSHSGFR